MAIPKSIYKVEIRDENYLTAWAYQFEDMSLPENEKFKSGLYPARVFLIEVSRADVEGVAEVWPGIDGAPVVVLPEMTTENTAPPYSYYPVFDKIEKINIGNGYESENDTVFVLSDEERLELWRLMRIDEWIVASDLPHEVPGAVFSIFEKPDKIDAMAFQSWAFKQYGEQLLIIPALPDENSVKICYFAPFDILTDIMAFIEMR